MSQLSAFIYNFKRHAFTPPVVRRAVIIAVVVGFILILINHSDRLRSGTFDATLLWQSLLTIFVPYAVSTVSSVLAIAEHEED